MRGQSPPLGLLLLLLLPQRISAAPPQSSAVSTQSCATRKCCHQCRPGYVAKTDCPMDPSVECVRRCSEGYFLNEAVITPRCEACMICKAELGLVEKAPCTPRSTRVCACRPGMYCEVPVPNSCIECRPLPPCKPGFGVLTGGGTSNHEVVCQECPPGTFSPQASDAEACKPHTDCAKKNKVTLQKGNSTHDARCVDQPWEDVTAPSGATTPPDPTGLLVSSAVDMSSRGPTDPFNTSHAPGPLPVETPSKEGDGDAALVGAILLSVFILLAALLILWYSRRTCRKWIVPRKAKLSNQAKMCAKRIAELNPAERGPEEGDLMNPEPLEDAPNGPLLQLEIDPAQGPKEAEQVQADGAVPVELSLRSNTSNRIEKIYIMRADTVIVGSVSEVPAGKNGLAQGEEGQEDVAGNELPMHYPEQETEFGPGSDITTPVEEEWEFHHSNEKPLAI